MLHAAILGLGRWGRRLVESVQPESQEIRFVAAVTGRRDPAIDFAQQHRMSLFDTLDHLIESGLPQAIVIATPHSQHHRQILQCLDAGLPVFVEKPVVLSTKEMEDVEEIQARTGLLVAAGGRLRKLARRSDL